MKVLWLLLLLGAPLTGTGPRPKPQRHDGCVRDGIAYAAATYTGGFDFKRKYARQFDQLAKHQIQQLLCSPQLRGLPAQEPNSTAEPGDQFIEQSYFAPLFVNLATMDGLYSMRHYGGVSGRVHCGYFHQIVVIAGKQFYALGKDTVANKQLVARLLGPHFTPGEIERMQQEYNRRTYCRDYTFLAPEIVRRGKKLLFDLHAFQ